MQMNGDHIYVFVYDLQKGIGYQIRLEKSRKGVVREGERNFYRRYGYVSWETKQNREQEKIPEGKAK